MNRLNGKNEEDRRIYERSARLLLLLALRDIAPGAKARFEHSIGRGIYLNVSGVSLTASLVRRIEARMHELSARICRSSNPAGRANRRSNISARRGRKTPCAC
ncbi:MAG: hypothetical protein ACLR4A_16440 [Christensenellales bacterium]